jgi:hypothetical protein
VACPADGLDVTEAAPNAVIELTAVLVAVTGEEPRVLTVEDGAALPSGPFESAHRTLHMGLRSWVERQTRHALGYIEQLYTFADRDRTSAEGRVISISYLGLTREAEASGDHDPGWRRWYRYFPWEDWRAGPSPLVDEVIRPRLRAWVAEAPDPATRRDRAQRVEIGFGADDRHWNEDMVLQRYELLYEARLVSEAGRRHGPVADPLPGSPMAHDHRRILATGIARLRAKIKYRPGRGDRRDLDRDRRPPGQALPLPPRDPARARRRRHQAAAVALGLGPRLCCVTFFEEFRHARA